ncbi:hypothetical protein T459_35475 [Capsicum annuum]|uniref:Uncharacterized protein n=1 Tax=Capsicum annuum TaxID=4072 RepID=A0A2G2XJ66_CAPAN|nr:hypothetical protein T459_35475 [Capsicum annuum]
MTSSSLTSSSSSLSKLSSSEISGFGVLPVAALKSKIVEKIQENRVTLLVGEIGCGTSLFLNLIIVIFFN